MQRTPKQTKQMYFQHFPTIFSKKRCSAREVSDYSPHEPLWPTCSQVPRNLPLLRTYLFPASWLAQKMGAQAFSSQTVDHCSKGRSVFVTVQAMSKCPSLCPTITTSSRRCQLAWKETMGSGSCKGPDDGLKCLGPVPVLEGQSRVLILELMW